MINTKKINSLKEKFNFYESQIKYEKEQLEKYNKNLQNTETAQKIIQTLAKQVQENAHKQISHLVTRCLKNVFGENAYEFKIVFEEKRGKTEARLVFVREGKEIDPTFASGGGIIDVASFALRLTSLILSRPHKSRILILDEPFKMLSQEYREPMRELILSLSKELKIQIIMVTHIKEFQVGKIVEL